MIGNSDATIHFDLSMKSIVTINSNLNAINIIENDNYVSIASVH